MVVLYRRFGTNLPLNTALYLLSMLFIPFQSYIPSHSCSPPPPNLNSVFLAWFSRLHLILYGRLPKFLCSVAFLTVSIFLISTFSFAVCVFCCFCMCGCFCKVRVFFCIVCGCFVMCVCFFCIVCGYFFKV